MENQSDWLWELSSAELHMEPFSLSYQLTLVTRKPLLEEHFVCSLRHLFRKVPVLRTCFGEQNGKTWLREMDDEIIDFEMVPGAKSNDLHSTLQKYKYNKKTGPLWCIKLRPELNCSPDNIVIEEMEGFPHVYSAFMGINHVITDGTTNAKICGLLVQLLDDVIAGKDIEDEDQLGVLMSNKITKNLIQECEAEINADPELRCKLIDSYKALQEKQPSIKLLCEQTKETEAKSAMLTRDLDTETTGALIKLCRAEGVTVNSAFTAVANLALVDLLAEGGLGQDVHNVRSGHVVNARRYWEGDTSRALGCHLLFVWITAETSNNIDEGFWDYTRSLNENIHAKLKSRNPFQEQVLRDLGIEGPGPVNECDFYVTNMGDLTNTVAKGGNHVQAVHVMRATTLEGSPCAIVHLVHTFRGKLVLTLVYNKAFLSSQQAEIYSERLFEHLKTIL